MKIRGKLITAFFIMTIIPIALIFLCVTAILNRQNAMFADDYNMEDDTIRNYDIVLNPVSFFYNIALSDYQLIYKMTQDSPNQLLNKKVLEQINGVLLESGSYLIVVKDKTYYFGQCIPCDYKEKKKKNE